MLEFFRKYQKVFFAFIAVLTVSSFSLFGVFSTFDQKGEREDVVFGRVVGGARVMLSEVQGLSRFIASDREERGNLCNDGVVRHDFLESGLGQLLVDAYFDVLKDDLVVRLEKAKRFHPHAKVQGVWQQFVPEMMGMVGSLQRWEAVDGALFSKMAELYGLQHRLPPETLRRIVVYQQQMKGEAVDPRLLSEDLSLFGFHSLSDWFGKNFIDLVSQFVLNAAALAEGKGYRVSLEEAKGDLIHHFQESVAKVGEVNFHAHLRSLGFDESEATAVWRKVLLFRKFFDDVGGSAFVDSLPYQAVAQYAGETRVVEGYRWPIQLKSAQDLAHFQHYVKSVAKGGGGLPHEFYSIEEVEKRTPQLVQTTYRANVAEVPKAEVMLRVGLKEYWGWELEEKNWPVLKKEFFLPDAVSRAARFEALERLKPEKRAQVDAFAKEAVLREHPEWIEEALAKVPLQEKVWGVAGDGPAIVPDAEKYMRVEGLEKIEEKHILLFSEARKVFAEAGQGEYSPEMDPFRNASREALAALQKNPEDPRYVQTGDRIADQFKLERTVHEIQRTSKEGWMKSAFVILEHSWSPVQEAGVGDVAFFYVKEIRQTPAPILEQIAFGKATLSADAKAWVAERMLEKMKQENVVQIPVQRES